MIERLESRWAFAVPTVTSSMPDALTLLNGAPLLIPLDGFDADGDALTYSVSSSNSNVIPVLHQGNRSMRIHVVHEGDGTAQDPSFEGDMVFELFEDLAPRTTGQIISLIQDGFYNGIIFHRVSENQSTGENFVIQGGDPLGTGMGGSDLPDFDDEFHVDLQHTSVGILSMAKAGDDTNNSQFFITGMPTRFLDFNHSVFGRLVEGENIRQMIANVPVGTGDKPIRPVTMETVELFTDTQNKVMTVKTAAGALAGETATITVDVSDGQGGTTQKTFTITTAADTEDEQPFLGTIPPITTHVNTPTTVTIPFVDADGGSPPFFEVGPTGNPNLTATINSSTGELTITPSGGIVGVFQVGVRVRATDPNPGASDTQFVPIYISPAAPSAPDLQAEFDTGSSFTDNITLRDNSSAANQLNFIVNGVLAGAQVQLFADGTLIGQGTVAAGATSITITTNGTFDLADGAHQITAVQTLVDQDVEVGNLDETVDLVSQASAPLAITIDTAAPTITSTAPTTATVGDEFTYDVQASGETTGFTFAFGLSPVGATINPANGVISWAPSAAQIGDQTFRVLAADVAGNSVEQMFTVTVGEGDNAPPDIAEITDKTANVGDLLTFTVTATDPDSDEEDITFSLATGAPTGAAIDANTGVFTWTPTAGQTGTFTITVRATDETDAVGTETFTVTVSPRPIVFQVINGDLVIGGTAGDDNVVIRGTNVPGSYDITGSLGTETVTGVTSGIRANLLGGNDRIALHNVFAAGEITIDTGDGNDEVRMGGDATVSSAQNMTVVLGAGDDQLHMQRVYVAGDITIEGGAGADTIMIQGQATNSQFWLGASSAGATTIRGGDGDDSIHASYSFVVGPWNVDGGAGIDAISLVASATSGDVVVSGGDGNDLLAIDTNYFVASLTVNGNGGDDSLLLKNSIALSSATLIGGDGNDGAEVQNVIARGLMIHHGAGQDSAAVRASLLQNLFADLGDGNDLLILQSNNVFGASEADGGAGGDQMMESGNLMRPARKRRIELFA